MFGSSHCLMVMDQADCLSDPTDVFAYLRDAGIGQRHALFYEAHAAFLELRGNCPAAESVYLQGIER
jgi:hypothetical protein